MPKNQQSLADRICLDKRQIIEKMNQIDRFCPICGVPVSPNKDFCCQAHELLFYSDEDFGFEDEEDFGDLVEILTIEEKKSKCF